MKDWNDVEVVVEALNRREQALNKYANNLGLIKRSLEGYERSLREMERDLLVKEEMLLRKARELEVRERALKRKENNECLRLFLDKKNLFKEKEEKNILKNPIMEEKEILKNPIKEKEVSEEDIRRVCSIQRKLMEEFGDILKIRVDNEKVSKMSPEDLMKRAIAFDMLEDKNVDLVTFMCGNGENNG